MSILIKGMKMPENGNETIIRIQPNGTILDQYGHRLLIKAIPLHPHGQLIEKNDVFKLISSFRGVDQILPVKFMKALYNLPTIIEAEEAIQKDGGRESGRLPEMSTS